MIIVPGAPTQALGGEGVDACRKHIGIGTGTGTVGTSSRRVLQGLSVRVLARACY